MTISATTRKRDKLAAQLTWLANRHLLSSPETAATAAWRRAIPMARLILPNGVNYCGAGFDISQSGLRARGPTSGPRSAPR